MYSSYRATTRFQYQAFARPTPIVVFPDRWNPVWSEPVRLPVGLKTHFQSFLAYTHREAPVDLRIIPWFTNLSEPVRSPVGLKFYLQREYWGPSRHLPTPDVTVTMAATEINSDIFLGAINVYDDGGSSTSGAGAKVSIVEIGLGGDPVSIEEE